MIFHKCKKLCEKDLVDVKRLQHAILDSPNHLTVYFSVEVCLPVQHTVINFCLCLAHCTMVSNTNTRHFDGLLKDVGKVSGLQKCENECLSNPSCIFADFVESTKNCKLFNVFASSQYAEMVTNATKKCPSMFVCQLIANYYFLYVFMG